VHVKRKKRAPQITWKYGGSTELLGKKVRKSKAAEEVRGEGYAFGLKPGYEER